MSIVSEVDYRATQVATEDCSQLKSELKPGEKIIHFIRHAEGHHNVAGRADHEAYKLEEFADASLSPLGHDQCRAVDLKYADILKDVPLVATSVMRRCLQTASLCFPSLIDNGNTKWMASEECREQTGEHPCDRRRDTTEAKEGYSYIDFSEITEEHDPIWPLYGSEKREPDEACVLRGRKFLEWACARPEKELIACTHSAILARLIPYLISQDAEFNKVYYENCELRSYIIRTV